MKTLERPRVRIVENQHYTIPADQVTQHIKRIVPKQAIVHYWYEVPEKSDSEDSTKKASNNPEDEVTNPQLKGFLTDMKKFGGLTNEDVEAMKKYSKEFRENFDL